MNFLIVVPKYDRSTLDPVYAFPMGLAYISSALKTAGYFVDILDLNRYYGYVQDGDWTPLRMLIRRKMLEKQYNCVCTGGLSADYDHVKAIIKAAKAEKPDTVVIVGGNLVSSMPETVVKGLGADFGVIGEGEETILEFAESLSAGKQDFSAIAGLAYLDDFGGVTLTPTRIAQNDINTIPMPDYEGFDIRYHLSAQLPADNPFWSPYDSPRQMGVLGSRACPFSCTFCYHPKGQKYRQRSMDSIFTEIDYIIKTYDVNMISLWDEMFNANHSRLIEFCERIKPYGIAWQAQVHLGNFTEEIPALLRESGCRQIGYGLESACDTVLKSMNKKITVEQIEKCLKATYKAKLQIVGNFIFGDKAETFETAQETLEWWYRHRHYNVNLSQLVPFPGTALFEDACATGLVADRLQMIENECQALYPLNVSSMTAEERSVLNQMLSDYNAKMGSIQARVLSVQQIGTHPMRGPLYSITTVCPHCGAVVTYGNMHEKNIRWNKDLLRVRMGCRECNQRYDTLPYALENKLLEIYSHNWPCRIGLYRNSERAELLLKNSLTLKERTACIIDENLARQSKEIAGIKTEPLYFNRSKLLDSIDVILILTTPMPSVADEIYRLTESGVMLYDFTKFFGDDLCFQNQEQALNYIAREFANASKSLQSGMTDEAFYKIFCLAELFHDYLPLHMALADIAVSRCDYPLAFDVLSTAEAFSPNNPDVINKYSQLLNTMNSSHSA